MSDAFLMAAVMPRERWAVRARGTVVAEASPVRIGRPDGGRPEICWELVTAGATVCSTVAASPVDSSSWRNFLTRYGSPPCAGAMATATSEGCPACIGRMPAAPAAIAVVLPLKECAFGVLIVHA
ncbi:hypothetical protein OG763_42165 [Streptomyces sp. NBC_01230]|uniref:hypothetical protein n=1 Tax=unclassified Streptomyces TaxID=2593676 RepID=UPI002E0F0653|nr:hypothetical protein OG763_42165 [Streptomyces sp. NBC_01230]